MMASFKLVVKEKVKFYEIIVIREHKNSLLLQLKHFHGDLKGWEEKDQTVDFPLVKITGNAVYFDGYTFEKISDDQIYVMLGSKNALKEQQFIYKRIKQLLHSNG